MYCPDRVCSCRIRASAGIASDSACSFKGGLCGLYVVKRADRTCPRDARCRVPREGRDRPCLFASDNRPGGRLSLVPEIDLSPGGLARFRRYENSSRTSIFFVPRAVRAVRARTGLAVARRGLVVCHHSWLWSGTLAPLLALVLAALALVLCGVFGAGSSRGAGRWFELRLGEQVSRPALETLMSTLAGGLPRPLFGPAPWVALSVTARRIARSAVCSSRGVCPWRRCARRSSRGLAGSPSRRWQGMGHSTTCARPCVCGWRVSRRSRRGSSAAGGSPR